MKKMNQVPNIVRNPAVVGELELDGDEVDPADVTPYVSETPPSSLSLLQQMKKQM